MKEENKGSNFNIFENDSEKSLDFISRAKAPFLKTNVSSQLKFESTIRELKIKILELNEEKENLKNKNKDLINQNSLLVGELNFWKSKKENPFENFSNVKLELANAMTSISTLQHDLQIKTNDFHDKSYSLNELKIKYENDISSRDSIIKKLMHENRECQKIILHKNKKIKDYKKSLKILQKDLLSLTQKYEQNYKDFKNLQENANEITAEKIHDILMKQKMLQEEKTKTENDSRQAFQNEMMHEIRSLKEMQLKTQNELKKEKGKNFSKESKKCRMNNLFGSKTKNKAIYERKKYLSGEKMKKTKLK